MLAFTSLRLFPAQETANAAQPSILVEPIPEAKGANVHASTSLISPSARPTKTNPEELRAVVIDGSNVAYA